MQEPATFRIELPILQRARRVPHTHRTRVLATLMRKNPMVVTEQQLPHISQRRGSHLDIYLLRTQDTGTPLLKRLLYHRPMYPPNQDMLHPLLLSMFLVILVSGPPLAIRVLLPCILFVTMELREMVTLLLTLCLSRQSYPRNARHYLIHRHSISSHDRMDNHTTFHRICPRIPSIRLRATAVLQHPIPNMLLVLYHIHNRNPTSRRNLPRINRTRPTYLSLLMVPSLLLPIHLSKLFIPRIQHRLSRRRTRFLIRNHNSICIIPRGLASRMFLQQRQCMLGRLDSLSVPYLKMSVNANVKESENVNMKGSGKGKGNVSGRISGNANERFRERKNVSDKQN